MADAPLSDGDWEVVWGEDGWTHAWVPDREHWDTSTPPLTELIKLAQDAVGVLRPNVNVTPTEDTEGL